MDSAKRNRWIAAAFVLALALIGVAALVLSERGSPVPKIAVVQVRPQEWADALKLGFSDGLQESTLEPGIDYAITLHSAAGDPQALTALLESINRQDYALVYSLGTQASQAAVRSITSSPILFGAVTDPVAAGLFDEQKQPLYQVAGTQDIWPYEEQFSLIRRLLPSADSVGVIYNSSEANSQVSVSLIRPIAEAAGFQLIEQTVTSEAEILAATNALLTQHTDAIYIPADNTAQAAASIIISAAMRRSTPVFTGIPGIVERGALATVGTNYAAVGRVNAQQAVNVLGGTDVRSIGIAVAKSGDLHINVASAEQLGIDIPTDLLDSATSIHGR